MKLILTGGGTGGHLYPGLAILEAMRKEVDIDVLFIGTQKGIESRIVPQEGIPFKTVWISGIHRGRLWGNMLFPLKMTVSFFQALWILARFNPNVVLGTGGYVSWPVLKAAQLLKIPTFIQEQNSLPGIVTRVLAKKVHKLYLSFESSKDYFSKKDHIVISGNPTRATLKRGNRRTGVKTFELDNRKKTLFIFGGSQGAQGLNRAMVSILGAILEKNDWQILWACGPAWENEIRLNCQDWCDRVHIFPYITDMASAYAVSDLIVCRAGATTISEITGLGLPALYIPFPAAAARHQEANARVLAEAGAAEMVIEEDTADLLLQKLNGLMEKDNLRKSMGNKAKSFGRPNAATLIAEDIFTHMNIGTKSGGRSQKMENTGENSQILKQTPNGEKS